MGPGDACCRGFSGEYQEAKITLIKVLVTLWTKDDLIFIPERVPAAVHPDFADLLPDWGQAGAFFTASEVHWSGM